VSAAGGLGGPAPAHGSWRESWLRQVHLTARATLATLVRAPRGPVPRPSPAQLAIGAVVAAAVLLAVMYLLDAWSVSYARALPAPLQDAARSFTHLGKSQWFLWPTAVVLLVLAATDFPGQRRFSRGILAAWAVRLGFVFTAIALPGLFVTIVKRLIGRARPFVVGDDVWAYVPFGWNAAHASFPSGHATTAFAALVAIGAIFPQARALMWIYAVLIALSRVVVTAHHPSDVIAGAIAGAIGALLVRDWFAARRLGFTVAPDGSVRAMPGPGFRRIVKAVAHRFHSA
jgi:membrane-associated phospholipid phosphatase